MLYKNAKNLIHLTNANILFFDIVAGILLGDTLAT